MGPHSGHCLGRIEEAPGIEGKSQDLSPEKEKLEDQVSQTETTAAGVTKLENRLLKGTQDAAETAARAEKMIANVRMMIGEADAHAHVQGQGIGAGHAPDPENAGPGQGPGPGPERGAAAAAVGRGRGPWT